MLHCFSLRRIFRICFNAQETRQFKSFLHEKRVRIPAAIDISTWAILHFLHEVIICFYFISTRGRRSLQFYSTVSVIQVVLLASFFLFCLVLSCLVFLIIRSLFVTLLLLLKFNCDGPFILTVVTFVVHVYKKVG